MRKFSHLIAQRGIIWQRTRVATGFNFLRVNVIHDQISLWQARCIRGVTINSESSGVKICSVL